MLTAHENPEGIGRPVWLVFAAPASDITTALEGAAFVMQRPAGPWERIPANLDGELELLKLATEEAAT